MARKGGFLKRSKSITGKIYTKPSIKPQNTRKIIRRFHLLINKRDLIYKKLSEHHKEEINESNISHFNKLPKQDTKPTEDELLSTSNEKSITKLYELLKKIEFEIVESGGLAKYQVASLYGQESKRGSDSSKWLCDTIPALKAFENMNTLEIGCLSTKNVISKHSKTITRIDLNSNEPGILKQDFMERPAPKDDSERFDLISCSLVLNFVPTPTERGKMMQRFSEFLLKSSEIGLVFVVLPLSCLTNSRYCDKSHFNEICQSLGFKTLEYHEAKKLVYLVLKWTGKVQNRRFAKVKLHDGPTMNNFCIVIE